MFGGSRCEIGGLSGVASSGAVTTEGSPRDHLDDQRYEGGEGAAHYQDSGWPTTVGGPFLAWLDIVGLGLGTGDPGGRIGRIDELVDTAVEEKRPGRAAVLGFGMERSGGQRDAAEGQEDPNQGKDGGQAHGPSAWCNRGLSAFGAFSGHGSGRQGVSTRWRKGLAQRRRVGHDFAATGRLNGVERGPPHDARALDKHGWRCVGGGRKVTPAPNPYAGGGDVPPAVGCIGAVRVGLKGIFTDCEENSLSVLTGSNWRIGRKTT